MITQIKLLILVGILVGILSILTGLGYITYNKVKDIGFQEASLICQENNKKYEEERDTKIAKIEEDSRKLVAQNKKNANKLTIKMQETIKQLKNAPLVIIKENKCELTETFSGSFAKINQTVNQNMKDTQK